MLPAVAQFKFATTALTGWMAAASPTPVAAVPLTAMIDARAVEPIAVSVFDENHGRTVTLVIGRDGGTDAATLAAVQHTLRCKVTDHEHPIAAATLGMLADVADQWRGKTIELVSAYRDKQTESVTSPHRAGRAIDFRVRDVAVGEVRDYAWRRNSRFGEVGIGWYPEGSFLHIDSRPGLKNIAWTLVNGANQYHPYWAEAALLPATPAKPARGRAGTRVSI